MNSNSASDNQEIESDGDYDPVAAFEQKEDVKQNEVGKSLQTSSSTTDKTITSESDDEEYDPEKILQPSTSTEQPQIIPSSSPSALSLPSKPMTTDKVECVNMQEAVKAIMQIKTLSDPNFVKLSKEEQAKIISEELAKRNLNIGNTNNITLPKNFNYDQVYSYNKPYKYLRDPIPLVPVNEFCRRPNITLPMSSEDKINYLKFLEREDRYARSQGWDSLPDRSRLFIGNLPSNTITKEDLFRIFSQYGELIEITIKAGYGFIQFATNEACEACVKGETGVPLHNKILRFDPSRPHKKRFEKISETYTQPLELGQGYVATARERIVNESENDKYDKDDKDDKDDQDDKDEKEHEDNEEGEEHEENEKEKENVKRVIDKTDKHKLDIESEAEPDKKKQRGLDPECYIYITNDSSPSYTKIVQSAFINSKISFEMEDVSDSDLQEVISDAAYSGINATCVIKNSTVDVQTFEQTEGGGVKFYEYEDVDIETAVEILSKLQNEDEDQNGDKEHQEEKEEYNEEIDTGEHKDKNLLQVENTLSEKQAGENRNYSNNIDIQSNGSLSGTVSTNGSTTQSISRSISPEQNLNMMRQPYDMQTQGDNSRSMNFKYYNRRSQGYGKQTSINRPLAFNSYPKPQGYRTSSMSPSLNAPINYGSPDSGTNSNARQLPATSYGASQYGQLVTPTPYGSNDLPNRKPQQQPNFKPYKGNSFNGAHSHVGGINTASNVNHQSFVTAPTNQPIGGFGSPPMNSGYGTTGFNSNQPNVQQQLLQSIQSLDHSSVNNMINLLQQQQKQQTQLPTNGLQQQPQMQPNAQVNSLLAQLQYGAPQANANQNRNNVPQDDKQSLKDMLARLSGSG